MGADGEMFYNGGPTPKRVRAIEALTFKDEDDRMFYREKPYAHWKPLLTEEDYRRLNAAVEVLENAL